MGISKHDRQRLRELASKATPGPWTVYHGDRWRPEYPRNVYVRAEWSEPTDGSLGRDVAGMRGVHDHTERDAAHIAAANPSTVTALLDALDAAEREIAALRLVRETESIGGYEWQCKACNGTGRNDGGT